MRSRVEIKEESKKILKGNLWNVLGNIIVITLIFALIAGVIGGIIGAIGSIFNLTVETKVPTELFGTTLELSQKTLFGQFVEIIGTIIGVIGGFGISFYVLNIVRGTKKTLSESLNFIKDNFAKILMVSAIYGVINNLTTLTEIIPGMIGDIITIILSIITLIAILGLAMIQPILIDNPELSGIEVINKSWAMMNGHKANYFVFQLSFIGWILLCLFIIPMIYVIPYIAVAELVYYEELKKLN